MKKILLYALVFVFCTLAEISAQHYIGFDKDEVKKIARNSGFYHDDITVNQKFNYLKFVNSADTKTLIVFFDDDDIAKHVRIVCDYSEYDFVIKDFNDNYKKKEKFRWEYKKDGKTFNVTLEEEEWYFVVRVKKK